MRTFDWPLKYSSVILKADSGADVIGNGRGQVMGNCEQGDVFPKQNAHCLGDISHENAFRLHQENSTGGLNDRSKNQPPLPSFPSDPRKPHSGLLLNPFTCVIILTK